MATERDGGLSPELEYFLAQRPTHPQMRDSASLWIMDESGSLALPRITVDAVGSQWDRPWIQLNLALSDGRALRVWGQFSSQAAPFGNGRVTVLGAGPLRFECLEPFRRWTVSFDGSAQQSTTEAQLLGTQDGTPTDLAFRFEAQMAAPPWLMGGLTSEAAHLLASSVEGALMGGVRYEQLCRIRGFVRLDGRERQIVGTGMRVRRQGVRNMAAATGHCQHSALFPSGRGFGAIAFAPRAGGSPSFNEGFVIEADGHRRAVQVIEAPWMRRLVASGDAVGIVLRAGCETIRIEGETLLSTFDHHLFEMAGSAVLQQSAVRYSWDGEETIGLMERCTRREQIEGLAR